MPDRRYSTIVALIATAVAVFAIRPTDQGLSEMAVDYGATPKSITTAWDQWVEGQRGPQIWQSLSRLVTALFVHGDFSHLLMNMVFLWTFGSLTARILGPWTALILFFLTGVSGNLAQIALNTDSAAPIVGASGAVCGYEGVYFGLALRWQLPDPDVWPLAHPIPPMQLAAFAAVGIAFDVYSLMNQHGGIAFGAHIGGFASGVLVAALISSVYRSQRAWPTR